MLIVSWNVASWPTTVRCIQSERVFRMRLEHSWPPGTFGSVDIFMRRLRCDILCLQETKASRALLQQQPAAAAAHLDGWDSFWSCNVTERSGFNGVCTYARQGTTQEANARPFGDHSLDDEGRALVTVHDGVAVINVYVPPPLTCEPFLCMHCMTPTGTSLAVAAKLKFAF
jgi:exonuclease III